MCFSIDAHTILARGVQVRDNFADGWSGGIWLGLPSTLEMYDGVR